MAISVIKKVEKQHSADSYQKKILLHGPDVSLCSIAGPEKSTAISYGVVIG